MSFILTFSQLRNKVKSYLHRLPKFESLHQLSLLAEALCLSWQQTYIKNQSKESLPYTKCNR